MLLLLILQHLALALAVAQASWLITQSYLFSGFRRWAQTQHHMLSYSSSCMLCTSQQMALLMTWIVPPLIPHTYGVGYLVEALFTARLAVLLYDLGEIVSINTLLPHEDTSLPPETTAPHEE